MMEGLVEQEVRSAGMPGGMEDAFECLPCMAMVERGGRIVAFNATARRLTGFGSEAVAGLAPQLHEVLVGAGEATAMDQRTRFDCLVVRRGAAPLAASAVAQTISFRAEPCRLLLLIEHAEGFSGSAESEGTFLEDVLDATPEATVITHEGRVLHVNVEFSRLFGYSAGECAGQDLDELVVPDGRMHESEMLLHSMRQEGRSAVETQRRTRWGELVDVAVLVAPVRLGGEARGLFVTYRDIRRQKQQEARLQYTALHDGLTGLANRALFLDRVELTLARLRRRPDRDFAVIFLDLDGFKKVNDTLGHAAGDALLLSVAARLKRCLRPQDTVARFGGDEFALLLDESGGQAEVERVAQRIQQEIRQEIDLNGAAAQVSASMGISLAGRRHGTAQEILGEADAAMYRAKAAGKGRHVVSAGCEIEAGGSGTDAV